MNYCTACGTRLDGEPKFCPGCGTAVQEAAVRSETEASSSYEVASSLHPKPVAMSEAARGWEKDRQQRTLGGRVGFSIGRAAAFFKRQDWKGKAVLVAIPLIVVVVLFGIQQNSAQQAQQVAVRSEVAKSETDSLAKALRYFNSTSMGNAFLVYGGQDKCKSYASVGFSSDYPDQVLVTLATPTFGRAVQFLVPTDSPERTYHPNVCSISQLPDSVKDWNASIDAEGHVLLNGHEQDCLPTGSSGQ
jgi:hypothetical protein